MIYILFVVLIVIASLLMIGIVLIQESKGGGLASNFSSSNAIMGVRKTTDFVEKATWGLAAARPHVAFSTKSVVLRTPMMALEDEKFDANPPPLDSWMSTMPIMSNDAITMSTTNKM